MDNKHRTQQKVITVPKKPLFSVLPYLRLLSLQTRTKLIKSLKDIFSCCKLNIVFKSKKKNSKRFLFLKIAFQKTLHLVSFMNFREDSATNPTMVIV